MNKKIISALALVLLLTFAFTAVGCNEDENTNSTGNDPYKIVANGTEIQLGDKADGVIDDLGTIVAVNDAGNCGGRGKTTIYYYEGFDVTVVDYEDGDAIVDKINLTDDRVETSQGVYIGSDKSDVIDAYGDPTETKNGALIYRKDGKEASFIIKNEKVSSISMMVIG